MPALKANLSGRDGKNSDIPREPCLAMHVSYVGRWMLDIAERNKVN